MVPFRRLCGLVGQDRVGVGTIKAPYQGLLRVVQTKGRTFPQLAVVFHALPQGGPMLLHVVVPRGNSSFVRDCPGVKFNDVYFCVGSNSNRSRFRPLRVRLGKAIFVSNGVGVPFSPGLRHAVRRSGLLKVPRAKVQIRICGATVLRGCPRLFAVEGACFDVFHFERGPHPIRRGRREGTWRGG